jgi:integrase
MIIRVHLNPMFGHKRLDVIRTEDVQRLKASLSHRSTKTVNNVLTVLNTMLKKAVEWDVIARMPCVVKLLPVSKTSASFYDFDEYERIVEWARLIDHRTYLWLFTALAKTAAHVTMLQRSPMGGDAGLRCGEIIALEWADVDLGKRQLCVRRSDWNGQVTTPKGGRLRYVPVTIRLASALRDHRHLRSSRVLCQDDGQPLTRQMVQNRMRLAARRANVRRHGVHILRHYAESRAMPSGSVPALISRL